MFSHKSTNFSYIEDKKPDVMSKIGENYVLFFYFLSTIYPFFPYLLPLPQTEDHTKDLLYDDPGKVLSAE